MTGVGTFSSSSSSSACFFFFSFSFSISSLLLGSHGEVARPEITLYGQDASDQEWYEIEFKHKPSAVVMDTTPTVVAPHQPRLDWQMWFAALGSYQVKATFLLFLFFSPSFFFSQFYPLLHIYFYFFPLNSPLLSIFLPLLP